MGRIHLKVVVFHFEGYAAAAYILIIYELNGSVYAHIKRYVRAEQAIIRIPARYGKAVLKGKGLRGVIIGGFPVGKNVARVGRAYSYAPNPYIIIGCRILKFISRGKGVAIAALNPLFKARFAVHPAEV